MRRVSRTRDTTPCLDRAEHEPEKASPFRFSGAKNGSHASNSYPLSDTERAEETVQDARTDNARSDVHDISCHACIDADDDGGSDGARVHEAQVHETQVHEAQFHEAQVHETQFHEALVHEAVHEALVHEAQVHKAVHEAHVHKAHVHEAHVHEVHGCSSDEHWP